MRDYEIEVHFCSRCQGQPHDIALPLSDAKEYPTANSKDDELIGHHIPEEFVNLDERKAFIEKLSLGESGEFGGWHYLKLKSTLLE